VIKGRNLAPKDKTGFSDPYVKIYVNNKKKAKTHKVWQNLVF
jgi:Ca2+-dependent lipid-binding protein